MISHRNITRHPGRVEPEEREQLLRQSGSVVWLTGLSGSGKSTIARVVEERLVAEGHLTYVLDGDNIRHGLNADLGFSDADRQENIRRIGEVAALFADAGVITLTAFISPFRADRDRVRAILPSGRFLEVFVDSPLATCETRDPKGLYRRARAGDIEEFTGISSPYEPPLNPEVTLPTGTATIDECVEILMKALLDRGILSPPSAEGSEPR
ncbi:MAG: adenylyl-sulfate kinase [Thermoanaerobaculia bacterium]